MEDLVLPLWGIVSFDHLLERHGTGLYTEANRYHPASLKRWNSDINSFQAVNFWARQEITVSYQSMFSAHLSYLFSFGIHLQFRYNHSVLFMAFIHLDNGCEAVNPWWKSLTGDPDVVQLRRFLSDFSGEGSKSELQLLPVQGIFHAHLLRSENTVTTKSNIVLVYWLFTHTPCNLI